MNSNSIENNIRSGIQNNPQIVAKGIAVVLIVFGILAMIGAIKNWDWLYKPDDDYSGRQPMRMGQVSRYFGRGTARVLGFMGGILLSCAGAYWLYSMVLGK